MAEFLPLAADRAPTRATTCSASSPPTAIFALEEVVATAILIAVAGHETTANMLGAGLIRATQPACDDVSRIVDRIDPARPRH